MSINQKLKKAVYQCKKFDDLFNIPWQLYLKKKCPTKQLKILILNAPCKGFGDLIFVKKLSDHLSDKYKCVVTIATTIPEKLIILGEPKSHLKRLATPGALAKSKKPAGMSILCRVFNGLKMYNLDNTPASTSPFDVYFVAPVVTIFEPRMSDMRRLLPKATKFNTFFFSEYNDSLTKAFDFHTGIGNQRQGLLLMNPIIPVFGQRKINKITQKSTFGPYALMYIGKWWNWENCARGFIEMVSKKYHSLSTFQIICPLFVLVKIKKRAFIDKYLHIWRKIIFITDKKKIIINTSQGHGVLYIRGDILPVKYDIMMGLMRYSVKDILVTGDQSITDAISCCIDKNIFYQIADWKQNFATALAKALPNKYLKSMDTSCGGLRAINYRSNYKYFGQHYNFFKNAAPKLAAIFCSIQSRRLDHFKHIVNSSKTLDQVKSKLV